MKYLSKILIEKFGDRFAAAPSDLAALGGRLVCLTGAPALGGGHLFFLVAVAYKLKFDAKKIQDK